MRLRVRQRHELDLLRPDVDAPERAAERTADPDVVAVLVGAEPARALRPGERRVEVRCHEGLIELALLGGQIINHRLLGWHLPALRTAPASRPCRVARDNAPR